MDSKMPPTEELQLDVGWRIVGITTGRHHKTKVTWAHEIEMAVALRHERMGSLTCQRRNLAAYDRAPIFHSRVP